MLDSQNNFDLVKCQTCNENYPIGQIILSKCVPCNNKLKNIQQLRNNKNLEVVSLCKDRNIAWQMVKDKHIYIMTVGDNLIYVDDSYARDCLNNQFPFFQFRGLWKMSDDSIILISSNTIKDFGKKNE